MDNPQPTTDPIEMIVDGRSRADFLYGYGANSHARQDILTLLAEIDRLRGEVESLKDKNYQEYWKGSEDGRVTGYAEGYERGFDEADGGNVRWK